MYNLEKTHTLFASKAKINVFFLDIRTNHYLLRTKLGGTFRFSVFNESIVCKSGSAGEVILADILENMGFSNKIFFTLSNLDWIPKSKLMGILDLAGINFGSDHDLGISLLGGGGGFSLGSIKGNLISGPRPKLGWPKLGLTKMGLPKLGFFPGRELNPVDPIMGLLLLFCNKFLVLDFGTSS